MNVHNVLAEFGREHGFGDLALNAANMTRLEFEGGLTVDFEYREQKGLYLYTVVATADARPAPSLLRALLEANAPAQNPDGFVFSIDPADQSLLLTHRIEPGRLSPDELASVLERFLDTLENWREHLQRAFPPDAPSPASPPAPGSWHMRA